MVGGAEDAEGQVLDGEVGIGGDVDPAGEVGVVGFDHGGQFWGEVTLVGTVMQKLRQIPLFFRN
jgi:hypothetical protein